MDDNNAGTAGRNISRAGNAVLALHPHFPDAAFEMPNVRLAHPFKPVGLNEVDNAFKSCPNIRWKRAKSRQHIRIQELNHPSHLRIIPFLQCFAKEFLGGFR